MDVQTLDVGRFKYRKICHGRYFLVRSYAIQTHIEPLSVLSREYCFLHPRGMLYLSCGYKWDGPSGFVPDVESLMRASAVHDALCGIIADNELTVQHQRTADLLYRRIAISDGCPHALAKAQYALLRAYDAVLRAVAIRTSNEVRN